nr:hypothetical protein [Agromyces marinus]
MAEAAQEHAVGEVGRPGVAFPPADVMRFDVADVLPAARAAAVALAEGDPLRSREEACGPTEVEREARRAENCGDQLCVGREPSRGARRDRLVVPVDPSVTQPGDERVEVDPNDDRGLRERRQRLLAAEGVARDRSEPIGLELRNRSAVVEHRAHARNR